MTIKYETMMKPSITYMSMSVNQTTGLTVSGVIKFDTVVFATDNTAVTLNTSSNQFTINQSGIWYIFCQLNALPSANTGYFTYTIHDLTSSIGISSSLGLGGSTGGVNGISFAAEAVTTITGSKTFEVRVGQTITNITAVNSGSSALIVEKWCDI